MVKYMEIARDILNAVQAGQLAASDKLPSIIQQAKAYDCSRGTVVRAYQFLMERNIVYVKIKAVTISRLSLPSNAKKKDIIWNQEIQW